MTRKPSVWMTRHEVEEIRRADAARERAEQRVAEAMRLDMEAMGEAAAQIVARFNGRA